MFKLRSGIVGLALTSALVLAANTANAADIYRAEGGSMKDPYIPMASWTGLYIGGNVGGAFNNNNNHYGFDTAAPAGLATSFLFNGNNNDSVLIYGGQIGYNYQRPGSSLVIGVEGDVDFADNIDYLATARGKVGFAMPSALIYATGGAAFIGLSNSDSFSYTGAPGTYTISHHSDDTQTGFVVGGGVEFKPGAGLMGYGPSFGSNISFGVEGLYYNFDNNNNYYTVTGGRCPNGCRFGDSNNSDDFWTVRAKINYHVQPAYEPLK